MNYKYDFNQAIMFVLHSYNFLILYKKTNLIYITYLDCKLNYLNIYSLFVTPEIECSIFFLILFLTTNINLFESHCKFFLFLFMFSFFSIGLTFSFSVTKIKLLKIFKIYKFINTLCFYLILSHLHPQDRHKLIYHDLIFFILKQY
jgi:hypothetical protein